MTDPKTPRQIMIDFDLVQKPVASEVMSHNFYRVVVWLLCSVALLIGYQSAIHMVRKGLQTVHDADGKVFQRAY